MDIDWDKVDAEIKAMNVVCALLLVVSVVILVATCVHAVCRLTGVW